MSEKNEDVSGPSSCSEEFIYRNFTASDVLIQGVAGLVNQEDVELMVRAQRKVLHRFEKTNEMLSNVNRLSATRLATGQREFKAHTENILEMKKELESIFNRIRKIKLKLADQMPLAYSLVVGESGKENKEEDDEYDIAIRERKKEGII